MSKKFENLLNKSKFNLSEESLRKEFREKEIKDQKYNAKKRKANGANFPILEWKRIDKDTFFDRNKYYMLMDKIRGTQDSFKYLFSLLLFNPKSEQWQFHDANNTWGENINPEEIYTLFDHYHEITFNDDFIKCRFCKGYLKKNEIYKRWNNDVCCEKCEESE